MAQDSQIFNFRKWNLKDNAPLIVDVRGMAKFSVHVSSSVANSAAWSTPSVSLKWADNPGGFNTRDFAAAITLTAGAPSKIDLDVSSVGYVVLAPASVTATDTWVDIDAVAKGDPS